MICLLNNDDDPGPRELQAYLETALQPLSICRFNLPTGPSEIVDGDRSRPRDETLHLLFLLLPYMEAGILWTLPNRELLHQLLVQSVPWIALDTPEARSLCGAGVIYASSCEPDSLVDAINQLRCDPHARGAIVRRGRSQARRLLRQVSPNEASDAALTWPVIPRIDRPDEPKEAIWSPTTQRRRRTGKRRRPEILAIVLAEEPESIAATLDSLERTSPISPGRIVVVLGTNEPELEARVRAICQYRAEVIQPGPPYRHGRRVNAGLTTRRASEEYAFWLESGTGLMSPQALNSMAEIVQTHNWTCVAPGGLLRPGRTGIHPGLTPREVAQVAAPGILWDLDWLERLGGLAEAMDASFAELELYFRLLQAKGVGGIDPTVRRQYLPCGSKTQLGVSVRCGVVTPALELGGAERWIVSLLQSTDARIAWQGVALVQGHRFHTEVRAEVEGVAPVLTGVAGLHALAALCDVLVVWGVEDWRSQIPSDYRGAIVLVSHGADNWTAEIFQNCEEAEGLVAVSDVALHPLPAHERNRAWVIRNAVEPARVVARCSREEIRNDWGVPAEALALGLLARFTSEKDPLAVARAVRYLPSEWVGVMVGWVNDLPELQRRAEAIAPGRIYWPGPTADVGSALAGMDTLLVASREEGFCYALSEAWLAGVPAVSTRVGIAREYPELIREIPYDAHGAAIAAAILSDVADAEGTTARISRARKVAQEQLSPNLFGHKWSGALLTVAGANPWGGDHQIPGIQVIITGHNVEPWLKRCLESVEASLSGTRWALILTDDGSTDRTWEIMGAHRSRAETLRRRRLPKAANAGQAKNRAIQLGLPLRKEYPAILLMDADDVMPRARVTHLLRGAVEGAHRLVHGALQFKAALPKVPAGTIVHPTEDQHARLNIGPPATILHESLLPPDGRLFCEDLDAMEDGELLCRWELAGMVSVPLPGPVVHEYWPRVGSVMWNEGLAENKRRFWERVEELRSGRRSLSLDHLSSA